MIWTGYCGTLVNLLIQIVTDISEFRLKLVNRVHDWHVHANILFIVTDRHKNRRRRERAPEYEERGFTLVNRETQSNSDKRNSITTSLDTMMMMYLQTIPSKVVEEIS